MKKHQKVFGRLLLFNVQDNDMTSDMKIRQNMGFCQGFGSGFGFGKTFGFSVSTETKKMVSVNH